MSEVSKIKIRLGSMEIDYEGPNDFLDTKLPELVRTLAALRPPNVEELDPDKGNGAPSKAPKPENAQSVATIAKKFGATTGRKLLNAAARSLGQTQEQFSRKELLAEMRNAKGFWKASYRSNLTKDLDRAVRAGELNHIGGENYSLPDTAS